MRIIPIRHIIPIRQINARFFWKQGGGSMRYGMPQGGDRQMDRDDDASYRSREQRDADGGDKWRHSDRSPPREYRSSSGTNRDDERRGAKYGGGNANSVPLGRRNDRSPSPSKRKSKRRDRSRSRSPRSRSRSPRRYISRSAYDETDFFNSRDRKSSRSPPPPSNNSKNKRNRSPSPAKPKGERYSPTASISDE